MIYLNNCLNYSHYLILAYLIYRENKAKKISLFLFALIFGMFESYINSVSSSLSSTLLAITYTFIYLSIFHKDRIDNNFSISTVYVTLSQCITFVFIMILRLLFENQLTLFNNHFYSLLIAIFISIVIFCFCIKGKINIFDFSKINKLIIPFIVIHMIVGYAGQNIMYNEEIEYKLIIVTIFAALFVVHFYLIQSHRLQKNIYKMIKQEEVYQKEIIFLKEIIDSYQNDKKELHDMYSLFLKKQDENEEIREYLKNHKPVMRIVTKDDNYNFVINMLINIPEFQEIQLDLLVIELIEIEKVDLLILFYELFKMYISDSIQVYSNNGLQIKMTVSKETLFSEELKEIIKKYKGIYSISNDSLILHLFYL